MKGISPDSHSHSLERFVECARQGGITLVLGAGVSLPRGLPTWNGLVRALWDETFGDGSMPEPGNVPQFLPLALDLIAQKLGPERFAARLKEVLYAKLEVLDRRALASSPETLAVVARLIGQEHSLAGARRLIRIITFNVDDLVERAVWNSAPRKRALKPIVRASHHPARGRGEQAIPIYHVHGYLPARDNARWHEGAPDSLVFTDSQYWSSVAAPMSFANRVMAAALHDSRCVFLGSSMTDINLMRWLAVRANELIQDKRAQFADHGGSMRRAIREAVERHFWIRPDSDDPTGFLSRCLLERGIQSVPIRAWQSNELAELFSRAFPEPSK